jgi:hypothetical protein
MDIVLPVFALTASTTKVDSDKPSLAADQDSTVSA